MSRRVYIEPGDQIRIHYEPGWGCGTRAIVEWIEREGQHAPEFLIIWEVDAWTLSHGSFQGDDLKRARDKDNPMRPIEIHPRLLARLVSIATAIRVGESFRDAITDAASGSMPGGTYR